MRMRMIISMLLWSSIFGVRLMCRGHTPQFMVLPN
jgi:hypothetical protein